MNIPFVLVSAAAHIYSGASLSSASTTRSAMRAEDMGIWLGPAHKAKGNRRARVLAKGSLAKEVDITSREAKDMARMVAKAMGKDGHHPAREPTMVEVKDGVEVAKEEDTKERAGGAARLGIKQMSAKH